MRNASTLHDKPHLHLRLTANHPISDLILTPERFPARFALIDVHERLKTITYLKKRAKLGENKPLPRVRSQDSSTRDHSNARNYEKIVLECNRKERKIEMRVSPCGLARKFHCRRIQSVRIFLSGPVTKTNVCSSSFLAQFHAKEALLTFKAVKSMSSRLPMFQCVCHRAGVLWFNADAPG